jgi:hypothetical protein
MIQEILQGKKSSCKRMKARSKEQLTTMMAGVIVFKNAEAVESLGRDDRGKTKKRGTKKIRTGEERSYLDINTVIPFPPLILS